MDSPGSGPNYSTNQQGSRRDSYGNIIEPHGSKDLLTRSFDQMQQYLGDIANGCRNIKVQRTEATDMDNSSSEEKCMCGTGADGDKLTPCTACSNMHAENNETKEETDSAINSEDSSTLFHVLPWQDVIFTYICRCLALQDIFRLRSTSQIARDCIDEYFTVCPVINIARGNLKMTPLAFGMVTYSNYRLHTLILRQIKVWLTDDVLVPAFASSIHLTRVDLTACSSISSKSIIALAGRAPDLKELYLRECAWLTKEAVVILAQNCRSLEKLDLTGCWAVDDEAVVMVSICCQKLVFLSIAKIYGITDYSVRCLATNCLQLQHVNMHGCWRVSDGAIQLLGEYCQKLRLLQVKECREITEISLGRLRNRGVKIDIQHPGRRSQDMKAIMHKLKLQV